MKDCKECDKTKEVDGVSYSAEDFAYVPNPNDPSTWELPIFDSRHVGEALAALTSDFRGHKANIPETAKKEVLDKVLARRDKLASCHCHEKEQAEDAKYASMV